MMISRHTIRRHVRICTKYSMGDAHTTGQMLGLRRRAPAVNMQLETQSGRMDGASERVGGVVKVV